MTSYFTMAEDLWESAQKFSDETFGPPSIRGPIGPLKHLEKEAKEAQLAPQDLTEYADCLLLIFDTARRAGFTLNELLQAALDKVDKNWERNWPDWRTSDPSLPIEHNRGEEK